ncbi:MAG: hypothetical protein SF052_06610 [Bacteroidia bacterium]|nr:hypothetical protein [Bacteroidia bacterium]
MNEIRKIADNLRKMIAADQLKEVLSILQQLLKGSPLLNEVISLSGKYEDLEKNIRLGTILRENASVEKSKIRLALTEMVEELEAYSREYPAILENCEIFLETPESRVLDYTFNEHLTRELILAIKPHTTAAQRFLERVALISDWESQLKISDKAKEIIAYSFVGVIGVQLGKLMAIGKEEFTAAKPKTYVEKCVQIARQSFDLILFSMFSRLWDEMKKRPLTLPDKTRDLIRKRLDNLNGPELNEQFALLINLYPVFADSGSELPLPEIEALEFQMKEGSELHDRVVELHKLSQRLEKEPPGLSDCTQAETQLTALLRHFSFLACYRMASIKNIGYRQIRHNEPAFIHHFASLGIDSKANKDAEKAIYTPDTAHTDAVLLYKGDHYQDCIVLSPFVIDYHTLTFEAGAKICFYYAKPFEEKSFEYLFLEDNSLLNLEFKGIQKADTDLGDLMMNKENHRMYNLDCVVDQLREARRCLLGDTLNFDDL